MLPKSFRAFLKKKNEVAPKSSLFEVVARGWHSYMLPRWTPRHAMEVIDTLQRDVFPAFGHLTLSEITPPLVLTTLRAIEGRGSIETARRVRQRVSAVFCFAIAEGLAETDPAAIVGKAMIPSPPKRHHPALLEIELARAFAAAAARVDAAASTKLASMFLALTAVRAAAVRFARWSEIEDLDGPAPLWRVPAVHMKMSAAKKLDEKNCHLVPLSAQGVEVLRAAALLDHDDTDLIFPGIGESALGSLCKRAGYDGRHVPHGWRASFSTIMNEHFPDDRAVIDLALAHAPKDRVEAAYNRAAHIARRRTVLQNWGDMLLPPAVNY